MTKEEIWNSNVAGWRLSMTEKGYNNALKAMDEYAKEIAIGFHNWKEERFIDIRYNMDYDGEDYYIPKVIIETPPPKFTIEQLFQSYLNSINQSNI